MANSKIEIGPLRRGQISAKTDLVGLALAKNWEIERQMAWGYLKDLDPGSLLVDGRLGRFSGFFDTFNGGVSSSPGFSQGPQDAESAGYSNESGEHRPECSITSGICGLPLGAKVGIAIILSWLAWPRLFAAYDCLTLRPRKLFKGFGELSIAIGLWGLCVASWLWRGT